MYAKGNSYIVTAGMKRTVITKPSNITGWLVLLQHKRLSFIYGRSKSSFSKQIAIAYILIVCLKIVVFKKHSQSTSPFYCNMIDTISSYKLINNPMTIRL